MAQCRQTPQEFIKNAFTPQIAVMCTPIAEKFCQKNNLDFIELLQPFSRLNNDVYYKDPSGINISIHGLKLSFLDITWRPPQTTLARKLLNLSVSAAPESRDKVFLVGKYHLDVPLSTPWFEAWRDTFLKVQYPSDHEFTKHFLACLLVVSSSDNNPADAFVQLIQTLNQVQNSTPGKLPKCFNSNVLKYYVILHDNTEGNSAIANKTFQAIKTTYGVQNCFLLKINSRCLVTSAIEHLPDPWSQFINRQIDLKQCKTPPEINSVKNTSLEVGQEAEEIKMSTSYHPLSPVNEDVAIGDYLSEDEKISSKPSNYTVHGICLSTEDIEQVKQLIYEFSRSCLMPYIEKQITTLNDVISNKKGMSKSLFSATKRWFSPNKPGASSVAVNNLIYAPDSAELQIRRLGDLYFMFGSYSAAFQAYHLAKRDYNTDQAWLYYAGALEMAALSAFMANESSRKTSDYMEESITTYLNTCKMPQFATRATILSVECLKAQNLYGEAAYQLTRMTSEESDLRSALLLEQASYCFLHSKMVRKYAFHMVLAGHRFSKAAQRKHSLMCYKQAYQIYENTGWDLASDHIHYTIGRQANNLQHFDKAVDSFSKLLKGESKQSAQQQAMFLKEYLTILGNKLKTESEADQTSNPILPVPELDITSLKVLVGPTRPLSTPGKIPALGININNLDSSVDEAKWTKLEEMLIKEVEGSLPIVFKPLVTLYTLSKLERNKPTAIINEPIQISFKLVNTLQTLLHLKELYLLWNFTADSEIISNETMNTKTDEFVKTYITKSLTIDGNSNQDLILSLTPLQIGAITINGFCYTLTGSSSATESVFIKGKQLINIPEGGSKNQVDGCKNSLIINVVPSAPCLQVTFSEMTLDFLSDELQKIVIDLQNTSSVPLHNIYMATSVPHLVYNSEVQEKPEENVDFKELTTPTQKEKYVRKNHITPLPLPGNILEPGKSCMFNIWVKATNKKGPTTIDLLIYYENLVKNSSPRYRLVRHSWNLTVQESVSVDMLAQASHNSRKVEELTLAMKITNLNKVHNSISTEVTLLSVGLLSKHWKLAKDIVTPKYINLLSQESAHILLKARRSSSNTSEYSNIPLNTDKKSVHNLNNIYLAFARKAEKPLINIFDDLDSVTIKENNDGILLMQWQALVTDASKKRIVNGQCNVPVEINRKEEDIIQMEKILSDTIIDINEKTIAEEETAEFAQKQVSCNLAYPPIVRHDFEKDKLCIVPIKLLLHSIIHNKVLSVVVNTTEYNVKPSTINKSNLFFSHASSNFSWVGSSNLLKVLNPLKTDVVNLAVVLTGPGTFNLGAHIQISCKSIDRNEPYVLQSCQIHATIIVVNKSS